jgi:hypothetical protein
LYVQVSVSKDGSFFVHTIDLGMMIEKPRSVTPGVAVPPPGNSRKKHSPGLVMNSPSYLPCLES